MALDESGLLVPADAGQVVYGAGDEDRLLASVAAALPLSDTINIRKRTVSKKQHYNYNYNFQQ